MDKKNFVITVDEQDHAIGVADKLQAHKFGLLHRAVSVFIFNSSGEWLIQQRALGKYHSAGLWSNTCCSHPMMDEANKEAAIRRLSEEMGIISNLTQIFSTKYRLKLSNGLTEHELDHVFIGICDDLPSADPEEVSDFLYLSTQDLLMEIITEPDQFTPWFIKLLDDVHSHATDLYPNLFQVK